jgi:hypothetical protein
MFTALRVMRAEWAGALVLGVGLKGSGGALALASLAVGATALFLESDADVLRGAQRAGCCTFVVTTLDEALRALKNEVRQGRAITVGLGGDSDKWLAEMMERGVLPEVVAAESFVPIATFASWGAQPVHGLGLVALQDSSLDLDAVLEKVTGSLWCVEEQVAVSQAVRRYLDDALAKDYAAQEPIGAIMRSWFKIAPSLFPRDTVRSYWSAEV